VKVQLPHLETDMTQACQLSCVACNHAVPLWRAHGPWTAKREDVARDLGHLATIAHTPMWGALGGEPTLNHDLVDILKTVRDTGIADRTSVWTNGLTARKMKPEFWRAFDQLVVSIYWGKLADDDIDWITKKCEDEGVEFVGRDERVNPNFMTFLEPKPTNAIMTQKKYDVCSFRRGNNYAASYGFFFMCCCGPHIPLLVQGRSFGDDGIKIEGLTLEQLVAYCERTDPLGACTHCAGRETAKRIPWRERRDPVIWLKQSSGQCP
jgi:cyclic pyranopterin phosphate synthase